MDSRAYLLLIPNFKNDNADKQCAWGVGGEAGPPYHLFKKAAGNTNEQQRETIEIIEKLFIQNWGAALTQVAHIYILMDQSSATFP